MSEVMLAAIFGGVASVLTAIGMMIASVVRARTSIRKSDLERLKSMLKERDAQLNEADARLEEKDTRMEAIRQDYYDAQDIVSMYRETLIEHNIELPPFKRYRDRKKKGRTQEMKAKAAED